MVGGMTVRAKLMAKSLAANPKKGGNPPSDMILMQIISLVVSDILEAPSDEILFKFLM